jgi:hypothetical protein
MLGSEQSGVPRPTSEQNSGRDQRTADCGQRAATTGIGQREQLCDNGQGTSDATSNNGLRRPGEPRTVASRCEASSGAHDKRVLPIAPNELDANPLDPMRRRIGQSVGSEKAGDRTLHLAFAPDFYFQSSRTTRYDSNREANAFAES